MLVLLLYCCCLAAGPCAVARLARCRSTRGAGVLPSITLMTAAAPAVLRRLWRLPRRLLLVELPVWLGQLVWGGGWGVSTEVAVLQRVCCADAAGGVKGHHP